MTHYASAILVCCMLLGQASIAQQPTSQPSAADMQKYMEMMGSGAVKIEDYPDLEGIQPSEFKGSFDMKMESVKAGKSKDEGTISWYIRDYDVAMLPVMTGQKQESRIIINRKKGLMTMLTSDSGRKSGMIMKMQGLSIDLSDTEAGEDIADMTVEVHKDVRRNIDGYDCYKVTAYNDKSESESWVTEELRVNMQSLLGLLASDTKGRNPYQEKYGHLKGMMIESTITEKKTGNQDIVRMKNIQKGDPSDEKFSTDGYELMMLPDLGGFGK